MDFDNISLDELELARWAHDSGGPRALFRFAFHRESHNVTEVEDCAIAFYTAYNKRVCLRY
jgi:hypothetical protein